MPRPSPNSQEALLMAKFGGMKPKPKLIPKDHKYFDSADWCALCLLSCPSQRE